MLALAVQRTNRLLYVVDGRADRLALPINLLLLCAPQAALQLAQAMREAAMVRGVLCKCTAITSALPQQLFLACRAT